MRRIRIHHEKVNTRPTKYIKQNNVYRNLNDVKDKYFPTPLSLDQLEGREPLPKDLDKADDE